VIGPDGRCLDHIDDACTAACASSTRTQHLAAERRNGGAWLAATRHCGERACALRGLARPLGTLATLATLATTETMGGDGTAKGLLGARGGACAAADGARERRSAAALGAGTRPAPPARRRRAAWARRAASSSTQQHAAARSRPQQHAAALGAGDDGRGPCRR
jgi:hypothetical protein